MPQEGHSEVVDKKGGGARTLAFISSLIEPNDTHFPGKKSTDAILIISILIFKSLLAIAAFLLGFRILMYDEVARWELLRMWVHSPFLAPGDHVWLGGFFYLCGTVMKIAGTSFAVCKILPLFFSFGAIIAMYLLCQKLYRSRERVLAPSPPLHCGFKRGALVSGVALLCLVGIMALSGKNKKACYESNG